MAPCRTFIKLPDLYWTASPDYTPRPPGPKEITYWPYSIKGPLASDKSATQFPCEYYPRRTTPRVKSVGRSPIVSPDGLYRTPVQIPIEEGIIIRAGPCRPGRIEGPSRAFGTTGRDTPRH